MSKTKDHHLHHRKPEKGQSIVLIAFAFIGLVAFMGLALDGGILFINYGQLRKAVDAASIAAAAQYRENYSITELLQTATEFVRLNGINGNTSVEICDSGHGSDPVLCSTPRRKLVRVTGAQHVDFAFLPIIGIQGTDLRVSAIGEAASMDVVLVIDMSESMSWDAACGDGDDDDEDGFIDDGPSTPDPFRPWRICSGEIHGDPDFTPRDPFYCNRLDPSGANGVKGDCHPFDEVKAAAADFAAWVLDRSVADEEDRLAIVVFSNGWEQQPKGTYVVPNVRWHKNRAEAIAHIKNLDVYEAQQCSSDWVNSTRPGTCRLYESDGTFGGTPCPFAQPGNPNSLLGTGDVSSCATTNIGMGLDFAGRMFSVDPNPSALWVTVLLTDGAANATELTAEQIDYIQNRYNPNNPTHNPLNAILPLGFCPPDTNITYPYCQDASTSTHHSLLSASYDADDYARDRARFVACDASHPSAGCNGISGQGSVIFSIGLGQEVLKGSPVAYGDSLLRFVASVGDDGNPTSLIEPCSSVPNKHLTNGDDSYRCGNYYYTETGGGLSSIFDDIASRIFTRLSQ